MAARPNIDELGLDKNAANHSALTPKVRAARPGEVGVRDRVAWSAPVELRFSRTRP